MDEANEISVEVILDRALVELALKTGLDLSEVTDRALRRALGPQAVEACPAPLEQKERMRREIAEEVAWYNDHVERHGLFSDEWRKF